MPIVFNCGACQSRLKVDDSKAGQVGPCPRCGQPVRIPDTRVGVPRPPSPATTDTSPSKPAVTVHVHLFDLGRWYRRLWTERLGLAVGVHIVLAVALTIASSVYFGSAIGLGRSSASSAASTTPGLGWSVGDFESTFSAKNGWYWHKKSQNPNGQGIFYISSNTNNPGVSYAIWGRPENLEIFRVLAVIPLNDQADDREIRFPLALIIIMAERVSSYPEVGPAKWIDQMLARFIISPVYKIQEQRYFGSFGWSVEFEYHPSESNCDVSITVTRR
jgi:hypothetical protein